MISALTPYPAYKDSGVPWLGDIPDGWWVARNGGLFGQRNDTGHPTLPILEVSLKTGVRVRSFEDTGRKQVMSDPGKYKRASAGDLAYNMMRMWQGAVGVAPVDGLVSPAYVVARPFPGVNGDYFARLFRTDMYMGEIDKYSHGIVKDRNRLYWEEFKQMPSPCPPPGEQAAITRFLDYADRRVRRYVRAKQKLIRLLEEQKQVLIHRAVTRGLDPNVRLKPSGIEWLGDVPAHWGVVRSRRLFSPSRELARPGDVQLSATQAYGVIPQSEFERRVGRRVVKIFKHLDKRRHVDKDDFVMSMRSFQGGLERAWESGAIRSSYVVLKPNPTVVVDFFTYLLKSTGYIRALQATADFIRDGQDLNFSNFCAVDLPLPPANEQTAIAAEVTRTISAIETSLSGYQREIALLREYHTRLIADVVTGKLDVREAARRLPDEQAEGSDERVNGTDNEDEDTEPDDVLGHDEPEDGEDSAGTQD